MKSNKKNISILGSTGSIGKSTLRIIKENPDIFRVAGLAAGENVSLLAKQSAEFKPGYVSIKEREGALKLERLLRDKLGPKDMPRILWGDKGAVEIATLPEADVVVSAIVGSQALKPTHAAARAGKRIALANKESVVMAGRIIMTEAKRSGAVIIPVDSEHSAIFQSMLGHNRKDIKRLILTASGGPFYGKRREHLRKVNLKDALAHPNWKMGVKITVDSATLMNKALEVIEARWLFDIPCDRISVMIHPQSIVHSIVEYKDGSMISQMGIPDMRVPISYALVYPERLKSEETSLNLERVPKLTFRKPKNSQYPTLKLAYRALAAGDSACVVLNAANEASVRAFVCGRIEFLDISRIIAKVVGGHRPYEIRDIEDSLGLHKQYMEITERIIGKS